ncbi:hypothetical protein GCM10027048_18100 [Hymenobacter coalescens]
MSLPTTRTASGSEAPAGLVNGETLRVVAATLRLPQQAGELLVRHGLPAAPQPGEWYPVAKWLQVLADIEAHYGRPTLYAAGLQVVEHSVWPEGLITLEQALASLNTSLRANIQGDDIGSYRCETIGPRALRVECITPAPADYEYGLITGLARRLKPTGAVRVRVQLVEEPAPATPGRKCFLVSW